MTAKHSKESFIERSREVHGDNYSYDKVSYLGNKIKVCITCREHGDFLQRPDVHMRGFGCPKDSGLAKLTTEEFIAKATEKHQGLYTYPETVYINTSTKVKIQCGDHSFEQTPNAHLKGNGCPICSGRLVSFGDLINKGKVLHEGKYEYLDIYSQVNERTSMSIKCDCGNIFTQTTSDHFSKRAGCPKCGHTISKPEGEITEFLETLGVFSEKYKLKSGKEIDIYSKDFGIGIEYNGLRWHSELFRNDRNYHKSKTQEAYSEGIRLIHIFEDEWLYKKEKIETLLKTVFGKNKEKFSARDMTVVRLAWAQTSEFLEHHHLQGSGPVSEICLGLMKQDEIYAVMSFSERGCKENEIELTRFCSKGVVRGGFSKLVTFFSKNFKYKFVISFSENRWSLGNVYSKNGFEKEYETDVSYWWFKGKVRYHRRHFQHKYLKDKFSNYNPSLSEAENCHNNGYFRIWDCGKSKWKLSL